MLRVVRNVKLKRDVNWIPFRNIASQATDEWNSLISSRDLNTEDSEIKVDSDKALLGTTFIAKDNIATTKEPTTCASNMLDNYYSPFDATVISLLEQEGLVMVGKANLDEFGMGSANVNSYYGHSVNPLFKTEEFITGGSSGGSAASIQGELATFSLGTDTGGSVRLPASYCGVVGFKPTYGRISRWGVIPYAQSLDTVGIFAKDVDTVQKVFKVLDKHDPKDPTSLPSEFREQISKEREIYKKSRSQLVFGVPEQFLVKELSQETREHWLHILGTLQDMGHIVRRVSMPSLKKLILAYFALATAEASSNLSRYDGIRYGFNTNNLKDSPLELIAENRSKSLGLEVQRRIILGNYTMSADSGNHYFKATDERRDIVEEFNEILNFPNLLMNEPAEFLSEKCDVIVTPTAMSGPLSVEEYLLHDRENFLNSYVNDILTVPASLAGMPAISIPWKTPGTNPAIPQGMQLMAQFGDDHFLLNFTAELMKLNNTT
mmetsp:Transcript_6331/g.6237  ORF Transcript_6331/g.6237 Transcript_6331/m.6237 type:complete len:491 (+) Transcript_6331:115-1587(+)